MLWRGIWRFSAEWALWQRGRLSLVVPKRGTQRLRATARPDRRLRGLKPGPNWRRFRPVARVHGCLRSDRNAGYRPRSIVDHPPKPCLRDSSASCMASVIAPVSRRPGPLQQHLHGARHASGKRTPHTVFPNRLRDLLPFPGTAHCHLASNAFPIGDALHVRCTAYDQATASSVGR